jgi:hypothetical protein
MKARQLIDGASFGPEALKVIGQAFDEAWASIAGNFAKGLETDNACVALANVLLATASDDSRDVAALKSAGLEVMRIRYQHRVAI